MVDYLKILRVTNSLYPEVMGGVGLHTHHMSRIQAELGHEVKVLTSDNGDSSLKRFETRKGYEIERHKELLSPLDNSIPPGIAKSIYRYQEEYDVVHIHSHLYFSSNIAAILNVVSDTPSVVTNHGLVSQTAPIWLQNIFNPTVGKMTFEEADKVLCYTNTDRERLRERGITSPISVISNGVNCNRFIPHYESSGKKILFVGRLKPGKGVIDLLKAFVEVQKKYPQWELEIIGDGPLLAELENYVVENGISEPVSFLGEVKNERIPDKYAESDIFVLPSLSEGLPRTVLESMACGVPVIVSDLKQLREVVDGAGMIANKNDPEDLSKCIDALISDPQLRKEYGKEGRNRVLSEYSWQDTVTETIEAYNDLGI